MEINFNNRMNWNVANAGGAAAEYGAAGGSRSIREMSDMTVTSAVASGEDIAAAGITDEMLRRDDDIGRLVASAFNLPPPPMPEFK